MRLIKLVVASAAVFFSLITAMSLLVPSRVRLSRATNMATADSALFLVATHSQWPRWHPALQISNEEGLPQQRSFTRNTIETNDSTVRVEWIQPGKAPVLNGWKLYRFAASDSVTLQWYMDFRLRWYPWEKFSSLFYEKTYVTMMEQGLQNIKQIVQKEDR